MHKCRVRGRFDAALLIFKTNSVKKIAAATTTECDWSELGTCLDNDDTKSHHGS